MSERSGHRSLPEDPPSADRQPEVCESRFARTALVAGLVALPLAPFVIGLAPAAIGLHAGLCHLRFRQGHRAVAAIGLSASAVSALVAAGAALAWGALLMTVLLTRSAVEQARGWEGQPIGAWRLIDVTGAARSSDDLVGRVQLIDVAAPGLPYSEATMASLAAFDASQAEVSGEERVALLSWAPEADAESLRELAARHGARHPLAVGRQDLPPPLALVSAKPTLFVVDADGVVRHVVLGPYDRAGLAKLVDAARMPAPAKRAGPSLAQ